eukprot:TRINITY_DN5790_c0_g1_i4.p1 TRINITY_DN5790_c0_g1~~TRINITY_DN5790_c0_g1_i4.p1  ORF type:complete len:1865 (-),score=437.72 TRINITY_DN5790_c0_g1_i4:36-5630(-)
MFGQQNKFGGFGAPTSSFGPPAASPFGAAPAPFGAASAAPSPFGNTTGYGAPQTPAYGAPAAAPAFGAPAPTNAFGAGTTLGGSTLGAFGAPAAPTSTYSTYPASNTSTSTPFGNTGNPGAYGTSSLTANAFGTNPASSPFGNQATQNKPLFGAPSTPGGGMFGNTTTAPQAGAGTMFGAPAATNNVFGNASSSAFGAPSPMGAPQGYGVPGGVEISGTTMVKFQTTPESDGANGTIHHHTITMMPQYRMKSFEELRWEDYQNKNKPPGMTGYPQATQAAPSMFGTQPPTQSPSMFGAQAPAPSPFGGAATNQPYGAPAQSTNPYGAPAQSPFGAAPAAATTPFGAPPATNNPLFGAPPANNPFGTTPAAPSSSVFAPAPFGTTGAAANPFGAAPAAAPAPFGAPAASPFGQPTTSAFPGNTGTSAFPTTMPNMFGAPGATTAPNPFGAAAPFGATTPAPFGVPGAAPSAFGPTPAAPNPFAPATNQAPAFGAPGAAPFGAPAANPFGAAPAPSLFPTTAPAANPFGASSPFPSTTPSMFPSMAPATPATPNPFAMGPAPTMQPFSMFPPATANPLTTNPLTSPIGGPAPFTGFGATAATNTAFPTYPQFAPNTPTAPALQATIASSPYGAVPVTPVLNMPAPPATPGTPATPSNSAPFVDVGSGTRAGPSPAVRFNPTPRAVMRTRVHLQPSVPLHTDRTLSPAFTPMRGHVASPVSNGTPDILRPRQSVKKLVIEPQLPDEPDANVSVVREAPEGTPSRSRSNPNLVSQSAPLSAGSLSAEPVRPKVQRGTLPADVMSTLSPSGAPARPTAAVDETPRLTRPDYFTMPPMIDLQRLSSEQLSKVANFKIGRLGVGEVEWPGVTDVRGLDLDSIVEFTHKQISVYPDEENKPPVGHELNKPATVLLSQCFPMDRAGQRVKDPAKLAAYEQKIKATTDKIGAKFISYNPKNGEWNFFVPHFSKYGLTDDDDDEEQPQDVAPPSPDRQMMQEPDHQLELYTGDVVPPSIDISAIEEPGEHAPQLFPVAPAGTKPPALVQRLRMDPARFHSMSGMLGEDEDEMHGNGIVLDPSFPAVTLRTEDLKFAASRFKQPSSPTPSSPSTSLSRQLFSPAQPFPQTPGRFSQAFTPAPAPAPVLTPAMTALIAPAPVHVDRTGRLTVKKLQADPIMAQTPRQIVDAGLFKGRSFRASWGAGGVIVRPAPIGTGAPTNIGALQVMRLVAVPGVRTRAEAQEVYLPALQSHLECSSNMSAEGQQQQKGDRTPVPSYILSHVYRHIRANISDSSCGDHPQQVWALVDALWGDQPQQGLPAPAQLTDAMTRKLALNGWLKGAVREAADKDAQKLISTRSSPLELIYVHLSAKQVKEAVDVALKTKDYRLATLIAQVWSVAPDPDPTQEHAARDVIAEQLKEWAKNGTDDFIDPARTKVYQILAGQVATEQSQHAEKLDWLRCFGLHMWYALGPASPISDCVDSFSKAVSTAHARAPSPPYHSATSTDIDTLFALLRLYAHYTTPHRDHRVGDLLGRVVQPRGYSPHALDMRLSWLLYTALRALPSLSKMVDVTLPYRIYSGFAFQLESAGLWEWALYVLLCTASGGPRDGAPAREMLFRHAVELDDARSQFLVQRLKVPLIWVHEARAQLALYTLQPPHVQEKALRAAGMWGPLHKLVVDRIAPAVISKGNPNEQKWLERLLSDMEKNEAAHLLRDWKVGGEVFLKFLQLSDRVQRALSSFDNNQNDAQLEAALQRYRHEALILSESTNTVSEMLERKIRDTRGNRGALGRGGGPLYNEAMSRVVVTDLAVRIKMLQTQIDKVLFRMLGEDEKLRLLQVVRSSNMGGQIPEDYLVAVQATETHEYRDQMRKLVECK